MIITHKIGWDKCLSHQIWPAIEKGWPDEGRPVHFFWGLAGNNIREIRFIHGDVSSVPDMKFDIVLANINRNIILQDMARYVNVMKDNAAIILSGFLKKDFPLILERSLEFGLDLVALKNKNKWQMAHLRKA